MSGYKKGKLELVGVLHLADMAERLGDQTVADQLRTRVEKSITESPNQKFVYIADILGKTKRKRPEAED